jgi:hypothetical protein
MKMSQLHKDIHFYTIQTWFHLKCVPFSGSPLYDTHGKHFGSFGVITIINFKWHCDKNGCFATNHGTHHALYERWLYKYKAQKCVIELCYIIEVLKSVWKGI